LTETPESARVPQFIESLLRLKSGEVLTVHVRHEDNPDVLVAEAGRLSGRWNFQKHRLGDGSWLLHVKKGR
jgi:uncharacterized protein (DUF2249 family)